MELRAVVDLHRRANETLLVANARNGRKNALHVKLLGTHAQPVVPARCCEADLRNVPHQLISSTIEKETEIGELGAAVKEFRVEGLSESTERQNGSSYALSLNRETQRREGSLSRTLDV